MEKTIIAIEFEVPGNAAEYARFSSNKSLLDYDIIVFSPKIGEYYASIHHAHFQGKPSIDEHDSFRLNEQAAYWRNEIKAAFESGKTIFIFLTDLEEVY